MTTRNERREAEMRRGAEVQAKHAARSLRDRPDDVVIEQRRETLRRWADAGKVRLVNKGEPIYSSGERTYVYYDKVAVVEYVEVAAEQYSASWPSEHFVAQVALAIGAMADFNDLPEKSSELREREARAKKLLDERARRDEMRKHVTPSSFWDPPSGERKV